MKTMETITLGVLLILIVGLICENHSLKAQLARLPELSEIQERIGVEPDGIYGEQTRKAWDEAINQQFADLYINERTMK